MRYADEYGWYELNPFPGSNQIETRRFPRRVSSFRKGGP